MFKCVPALRFAVQRLLFCRNGDFLCVHGERRCSVIEVTRRARTTIASARGTAEESAPDTAGASDNLTYTHQSAHSAHMRDDRPALRQLPIGEYFHSTHPTVRIMRVRWHPLSDRHLAVLTSDSTLRLYDVNADSQHPVRTLRLHSLSEQAGAESRACVDFCFGPIDAPGWHRFSCYFLYPSGSLYSMCPLVPRGCLIDGAHYQALEYHVASELVAARLSSDTSNAPVELARSSHRVHALLRQQRWLATTKALVVVLPVQSAASAAAAAAAASSAEVDAEGGAHREGELSSGFTAPRPSSSSLPPSPMTGDTDDSEERLQWIRTSMVTDHMPRLVALHQVDREQAESFGESCTLESLQSARSSLAALIHITREGVIDVGYIVCVCVCMCVCVDIFVCVCVCVCIVCVYLCASVFVRV
jgi:Nuclear pore component